MDLPKAGDAFAFPIGDGRYSVARVILDQTSERAKQWSTSASSLVVCSTWIGNTIPDAKDPSLRPILRVTHHSWQNELLALWIPHPVPSDFVPIGTIAPTPEEEQLPNDNFGFWPSLTIHPLLQWRWDHDRTALLAEEADRRKLDVARRREAEQRRQEYLSHLTLEDLRDRQFFAEWKLPSPADIAASRKIMTETVERLINLGPLASVRDRMGELQECIESFNDLDEESNFIETEEREDICYEFEAIVHACGLGSHKDLADQWRDW